MKELEIKRRNVYAGITSSYGTLIVKRETKTLWVVTNGHGNEMKFSKATGKAFPLVDNFDYLFATEQSV